MIWIRLFSKKSGCDKGTLYQLKNVIHRTSVPSDPEDNMNAAEDFMQTVLEGYIVGAANELMGSKWEGTLPDLAEKIVENYVRILVDKAVQSTDEVFTYTVACEVISLGLLWFNYRDATQEGDGNRVMMIWKFLLLVFKSSGRRNYAKEAAMMLLNYHCIYSDQKAAQIKNSRFVNTVGRKGCNIPCDLFMEHLNRRQKRVIRHMGSNVQPPSLVRAAKAIRVVNSVCTVIEEETRGRSESNRHSKPSSSKDFKQLLEQIIEHKLCKVSPMRRHTSISIKQCLLETVDKEKVESWIVENVIPTILFK